SPGAEDARRLGYLRSSEPITMNRERQMADAKALALERVREGYRRPAARTAIPVGGDGVLAALKLGVHLAWRAGRISEHDAVVGGALAGILAGCTLPHQSAVSVDDSQDCGRDA